jgi:hypothetical protein
MKLIGQKGSYLQSPPSPFGIPKGSLCVHLTIHLIFLGENSQVFGYCNMFLSFKLDNLDLKCKVAFDLTNGVCQF